MKKLAMSPIYKIGRNKNNKKIKLRIGVFFDGTGNNKYNSDSGYYSSDYYKNYNCIDETDKTIYDDIKKEGSSYWNSYSNIVLLHQLYEEKHEEDRHLIEHQLKFYIEGIGTKEDKEDDTLGSALGEGDRGVISRVEEACEKIFKGVYKAFRTLPKNIKIESIQFDVFGFSRGAAAARHFCNEVLKTQREPFDFHNFKNLKKVNIINTSKPKNIRAVISKSKVIALKKEKDNLKVQKHYFHPTREIFTGGYLGKLLKNKNIFFPKENVSIEFLGLFDTVISQMLEKTGAIDLIRTIDDSKIVSKFIPVASPVISTIASIKKVNTNLNNPNIKNILQIKAQDEWRENFPITPIGKTHRFTSAGEVTVLGAHSDIGGGYWQTYKEFNKQLHFCDISVDANEEEKQKMEEKKNMLLNWYISEGLCKPEQIWWKTLYHVREIKNDGGLIRNRLLEKDDFMETQKKGQYGDSICLLVGYHYQLQSNRILNNKLALVYMNVMKEMAKKYANVPFFVSKKKVKHSEEYLYSEYKDVIEKMKNYEELMKKVTEHGWINKKGQRITYPKLFYSENKKLYYKIPSDQYTFIKENYVHLSANFNTPITQLLDHKPIAYVNRPRFSDKHKFKKVPYERALYTPSMDTYDTK